MVLLVPGSSSDPTDDCFKNSSSTKMAQQTAGCHELDVAQLEYFQSSSNEPLNEENHSFSQSVQDTLKCIILPSGYAQVVLLRSVLELFLVRNLQ